MSCGGRIMKMNKLLRTRGQHHFVELNSQFSHSNSQCTAYTLICCCWWWWWWGRGVSVCFPMSQYKWCLLWVPVYPATLQPSNPFHQYWPKTFSQQVWICAITSCSDRMPSDVSSRQIQEARFSSLCSLEERLRVAVIITWTSVTCLVRTNTEHLAFYLLVSPLGDRD